jgi:hypothetical protein
LFKKGHFLYSVGAFIDKLNGVIRGFVEYFSYTYEIRLQLCKLDNLIFKYFWKWLMKKFKSKPKPKKFIMNRYFSIQENTFIDGERSLIKLKSHSCKSFLNLIPPIGYYNNRNPYLNIMENEKKLIQKKLLVANTKRHAKKN